VAEIVKENWDILGKSLTTQFLHKNRPFVGFRRPPNLKDLLVKAEVRTKEEILARKNLAKPQTQAQNLNFPNNPTVGLKQSQISDFFTKRDTLTTSVSNTAIPTLTPQASNPRTLGSSSNLVRNPNKTFVGISIARSVHFWTQKIKKTSKVTGETFQAKTNITCQSSNIIYCLICKHCGSQYVGQTLRKISERVLEHLLNIKHLNSKRKNPNYTLPPSFVPHSVGLHFSSADHPIWE
jgi:hypothetical protein